MKGSGAVGAHQKQCLLNNLMEQTAQMAATAPQEPQRLCIAQKEHISQVDVRCELKTV